jgi:ribosome biogenesis protein ENP2
MPNNTLSHNKKPIKLQRDEIINSIIDLSFPSLIKKIKQTKDAGFLIGYGGYPPQVRCFDLYNLGLKFQRTFSCEINDFQIITQNWEKIIFLRSDKHLEFHSKSGFYYQFKIPNTANSLAFDDYSKILYIFSLNNEILRFNLDLGKFIPSFKSNIQSTNTSSAKSLLGNFISLGNSKGIIEIWDLRVSKRPVCLIDSLLYLKKKNNNSVTSLYFCKKNIYKLYTGFSSDDIVLYDLRNLSPMISKKIGTNFAIHTIKNNQNSNLILCADKKIIKLWDETNGKTSVTIKPKNEINHVCIVKNTGFVFISTTDSRVDSRYIPLLGTVPPWCYPLGQVNRKIRKSSIHTIEKKNLSKNNKILFCLEKLTKFN